MLDTGYSILPLFILLKILCVLIQGVGIGIGIDAIKALKDSQPLKKKDIQEG